MEFSDEQLKQWIYDHEYDWDYTPDPDNSVEWEEWYSNPFPSDTFPKYYQVDYDGTIAGLCREILSLRAEASAAKAAAVAAFDGNGLIQQAHHERDWFRDKIAKIQEILDEGAAMSEYWMVSKIEGIVHDGS